MFQIKEFKIMFLLHFHGIFLAVFFHSYLRQCQCEQVASQTPCFFFYLYIHLKISSDSECFIKCYFFCIYEYFTHPSITHSSLNGKNGTLYWHSSGWNSIFTLTSCSHLNLKRILLFKHHQACRHPGAESRHVAGLRDSCSLAFELRARPDRKHSTDVSPL